MVKKYLPWQGILLLFLGLFFLRNWMLPMVSDDIPYAFIWDGADRGNLLDGVGMRQRITSFGDIIVSQWSHYMTWGGRILGIGLTQLFAGEDLYFFRTRRYRALRKGFRRGKFSMLEFLLKVRDHLFGRV